MTVITLSSGRQVIGILTHSRNAVVTARASPDYLEVIDRDRRVPDVGTVTVLADVGRADVIQTLTGGGHAIMAIATGLGGDVLVIKVRG